MAAKRFNFEAEAAPRAMHAYNDLKHKQHILRLSRETSHKHLGINPASPNDEEPGPTDYGVYLGMAKNDNEIPMPSNIAGGVVFEVDLPPELRDMIFDHMIGPLQRQIVAPPVSNYCIGYDYLDVPRMHFQTNLQLAWDYEQRLSAALKANAVLFATMEATLVAPKHFSWWGLLDKCKERSACDPTRPRPSIRQPMQTEFPSPIGSILGAAVKVEPLISRRRYTDIGFGPAAVSAMRAMANLIVKDLNTYNLNPNTGKPDIYYGLPSDPALPEAVRVRSLERFIRQMATQLRLDRSVAIKLDVGPWDLTISEDKQDFVRDLRSLAVNHNLKIRLVLVTAAMYVEQWRN
jgi:hypothetical protein